MKLDHQKKETIKAIFFFGYLVLGLSLLFIALGNASCKKMVSIDEPVSSITTKGTFSSDVTATSAVVAIYSKLINTRGGALFGSGGTTIYTALSSDELTKIGVSGVDLQFNSNDLLKDNFIVYSQLWSPAYFAVYQANSCIEGLQKSESINERVKNQLIGECKFLRAFSFFYLTNLWGDIPMPLTSDWNQTYLLERTPKEEVYNQVITDLKDAQNLLPNDYSISNNEKIRANRLSATALLARVYLYMKDWPNVENEASDVINSGVYTLNVNLNEVFLKNSSEAILQFQPDKTAPPFAVVEQFNFTGTPLYYLTNTLLSAFENGDLRAKPKNWLDTIHVPAITGPRYFYPFKYKVRQGTSGGNITEYYMVLRLAEQYLIRAEARANGAGPGLSGAVEDINKIRVRAGLPNYGGPTNKDSVLMAIEHERQVEFFCEWGHRWLDLIRTNRASSILGAIKGTSWQATDQLYPIPLSEMQKNPNLTQNAGYN